MSEFKHRAGVAEAIGWLSALTDAVQDGTITIEQGKVLAEKAGDYVGELLMGRKVHGRSLDDVAYLDSVFDRDERTFR